ncbi:MAG: hypothetical protein LUG16_05155, partial [Candidatus Gastranaerophilales bacterium]|nr:hypothetical protein [Candidatus Gastranaerophilales bacterium]
MQLLEVKNDTAKIIYNPEENHLLPADFLLIEDINQKLITQIVNIEAADDTYNNLATLRLSLSIDREDNLSCYNGYIPSRNSKILYINSEEILELIKGNTSNIYFGNLSNHPECFVNSPVSFVDDKVYIQSDREDKTKIIVQNLITELCGKNKKVILLDFNGLYNNFTDVIRYKISDNMRLPLNEEAFNTILEYDTNDCPIQDKAFIQSIFLEIREYLSTLDEHFVPFTAFKTVVDNEFLSNPIPGLMLLRNKLWLYAQNKIFAEDKIQFDVLDETLEEKDIVIIEASNVEEKWYKFIIQTILSLVKNNCYFILSLNDVFLDKKSIVNLYNKQNIIPVVSTGYDYEQRQILQSVCKNQILCKSSKTISDEEP